MSKLAEAIRRTMRAESAPMGFGAARPAPKATMLVGVIGKAAASPDADVIVIDSGDRLPAGSEVARLREANPGAAVGVKARNADRAALAELAKQGLDFLVFDAESTPASALLEDSLGFVLALPDRVDGEYMRSLEALSLDAFYLADLPSPLTVQRQLDLMRIAVVGRRPVMARVPGDGDVAELEALRAAGVAVLLLEDASGVKKLKEAVLALPPRRARREERPAISIPRAAVRPEHDQDDDDDDDRRTEAQSR
jgi:hypothetical protein